MTKHRHRYLNGLLGPRRPQRFYASSEDYGKTRLDLSWDELEPDRFRGVISWSRSANNQTSKSEAIQALLILIAGAQSQTLVEEAQEPSWDLRGFCEDAELSQRQVDVIVLVGEGWSQREIASWLGIGQATVSRHLHSGRHKLAGWLPLEVAYKLAGA